MKGERLRMSRAFKKLPDKMMIKWTELPNEIISIVSDHLSFFERRTLSMVNRRCRQILSTRREKFAGVIVRGMPSINV
ncbi:F-box domain protein [Ancylostoma duodenale]|uniref:F-box domain protein n=1 Tax=Ancylostoma duodenale TaxID=51022 RepID=A0A0C2DGX5_9BILA|nr:F-box domain protein [Ancylostoma duodenale]